LKKSSAFALSAALLASAACNALDKIISVPLSPPIATISMNTQASGGGFVTAPIALFYRAVDNSQVIFTSVGTPDDMCHVRSVNNSGLINIVDTLPTAASPVSAGAFATMQLSGHSDTLLAPGSQSVAYHAAASVPFVPGDMATFTIPGSSSGFPSATVSLMTAEAFTMDTVRFAPSGQDVPLNWTPASAPGSVLNFTINYVVGPTTSQIYCQFVDDGHASLPAALFATFPNVNPGALIGFDAIRMRTALVQLPGSGAVVNVISVFEFPTPRSP
jgi:hypothetical protein